MPVILICGEKGGTGKSTLSTNLAIMASMMGRDVLLLDADKQATSSKFLSNRNDKSIKPTPTCVQIRGKYLHKEIEDLSERYELIIIDAGGQDSVEMRSAMSSPIVNKLYIPLAPTDFDVDTMINMNDLICTAQSFNQNLVAFVIFNQAPTHSKITLVEEAKEKIKPYEHINICKSVIGHRVNFQYTLSYYMSIVEFELDRINAMPEWRAKRYIPKGSIELCNFYQEIFNQKFETQETKKLFNNIGQIEEAVA
jgi:chromosome partitioning protein